MQQVARPSRSSQIRPDSPAANPGAESEEIQEEKEKTKRLKDIQRTILSTREADKCMTFRADMFSLLYVSLVKPQYKMYCDLVASTG